MKKVVIYTLSDPRTGEVRYVGKATQRLSSRYSSHCKKYNQETNYKANWIKSLIKANLKPVMDIVDILEEEKDINDWEFWEQYWISQFRQWGFRLTNLSNGGQGVTNFKWPKRGPMSEETRKKISIANKQIKRTKDWINKVAEANKKPIIGIKDNIEYNFNSATDAALIMGNIDFKKNIVTCLKGRRKTAYGYKWKYKNTEIRDKEPL